MTYKYAWIYLSSNLLNFSSSSTITLFLLSLQNLFPLCNNLVSYIVSSYVSLYILISPTLHLFLPFFTKIIHDQPPIPLCVRKDAQVYDRTGCNSIVPLSHNIILIKLYNEFKIISHGPLNIPFSLHNMIGYSV